MRRSRPSKVILSKSISATFPSCLTRLFDAAGETAFEVSPLPLDEQGEGVVGHDEEELPLDFGLPLELDEQPELHEIPFETEAEPIAEEPIEEAPLIEAPAGEAAEPTLTPEEELVAEEISEPVTEAPLNYLKQNRPMKKPQQPLPSLPPKCQFMKRPSMKRPSKKRPLKKRPSKKRLPRNRPLSRRRLMSGLLRPRLKLSRKRSLSHKPTPSSRAKKQRPKRLLQPRRLQNPRNRWK